MSTQCAIDRTTADNDVAGTQSPARAEERGNDHDPDVFAAALEYFAADLQHLAHGAPVDKRDPLLAIVGLMRTVAAGP